ncbi:unnamed protein product [Strongylus vulgaris]|uniref:Uncharacterized protein n=1 Tax=Strongylus vulgaris TaxID=40348 RepID=A0A3P7JHB0_STRVU|nr:unnamed protein product [Strongylus vulgaris]
MSRLENLLKGLLKKIISDLLDYQKYEWKHAVLSHHIRGRRIALTMREPSRDFLVRRRRTLRKIWKAINRVKQCTSTAEKFSEVMKNYKTRQRYILLLLLLIKVNRLHIFAKNSSRFVGYNFCANRDVTCASHQISQLIREGCLVKVAIQKGMQTARCSLKR